MFRRGRIAALTAWCIIILVLTLFPGNRMPDLDPLRAVDGFDLLVHGGLFFVFGVLFYRFIRQKHPTAKPLRIFLYTLIAGIFFGSCTEFLQFLLPIQREASFFDLTADITGTLSGSILCKLSPGIRERCR